MQAVLNDEHNTAFFSFFNLIKVIDGIIAIAIIPVYSTTTEYRLYTDIDIALRCIR